MSVRLYLHCGLPRTGTSSLQAVLAERSERLAEVGVVYPDRWRPRQSDAHYGIGELLEPAAAIEGFQAYMRSQAGGAVLISCEALSNWLPEDRRESLIGFLRGAGEVAEVTCLWALRRLDRWASSMYLHLIETGREVPPPDEYFHGWAAGVADVFAGLREVESSGCASVYVRYDDAGSHYGELLRAAGVSGSLREEIESHLRDGPRRNRSPAAKAGRPGDLVDAETAEGVRGAALRAAHEVGFDPYLEFFAMEA